MNHIQIKVIPPEQLVEYALKHNLACVTCELCGTTGKYQLDKIVYQVQPITMNVGLVVGLKLPTIPFIHMVCLVCGKLTFISIYVGGLDKRPPLLPEPVTNIKTTNTNIDTGIQINV